MNSTAKLTIAAACMLGFASAASAVAPDFMEKLTADSRPADDRARDGARRPYQVMMALGVEEGMTAIDVGAGGGWYTRVLSAAVGDSGQVISHAGPRALQRNNGQANRDLADSLSNTEVSFEALDELDAGIADVAVTALNMHHGNAERNVPYLQSILRVLKSGGQAAIIDHIGSPDADNSGLHRMPIGNAREWIEAAGFEIIEESNLLRTAADDHSMAVFDPRLGRNSDRFLFIVRKP